MECPCCERDDPVLIRRNDREDYRCYKCFQKCPTGKPCRREEKKK